jgi:hypothetical protein
MLSFFSPALAFVDEAEAAAAVPVFCPVAMATLAPLCPIYPAVDVTAAEPALTAPFEFQHFH